jgi:hypothetical protein
MNNYIANWMLLYNQIVIVHYFRHLHMRLTLSLLFSGYAEKVAGTSPGDHTVPCRQTARSPFHQRVPLRGKKDRS